MRHKSESLRRERAERYLERARELYIGKPGEMGFVGYDLSRALINARRALMLDPNSYDALVLTGDILWEQDESQDGFGVAIGYFDKAISLEPEIAKAYDAKAGILFDAGEFRQAVAPAWKAWRLTLFDQDADEFDIEVTTDSLRNILVKLGKWDLARRVLDRALKRVASSDWLLRLLDWTNNRIEWAASGDPAGPGKGLRRVK